MSARDGREQVDRIGEATEYWSEGKTEDGREIRRVVGWNPESRRFFLDSFETPESSAEAAAWEGGISAATYGELVALVAGVHDGVEFTNDYGEDYRGQRADELRFIESRAEQLRADRRATLGISAAEEAAGVLDVWRSDEGNTEYRLAPGSRNPTRPFFGYQNEVRVGWNPGHGEFYFTISELEHGPWGSALVGRQIAFASVPDLDELDERLGVYAVLPHEVRVRLEADRSRDQIPETGREWGRLEFAIARDGYERAARAWRNREAPFETLMDAFGVYARATGRLLESEGSLEALREALEAPRSRATAVLEAVDEYAAARRLVSSCEREIRLVGKDERPRLVGHEEKAYFRRRAEVLDGWRDPSRVWSREDYDVFGEWNREKRDFAHEIGYGLARDRVERARAALVDAVPIYGRTLLSRLENGRPHERLSDVAVEGYSSLRDSDRARVAGHIAGVMRGIEDETREIAGQKAAIGHDSPLSKSLPKLIAVRVAVERAAALACGPSASGSIALVRSAAVERSHGISQS